MSELLQRGFVLHQSGQFEQAETVYRQLLDVQPDSFDGQQLLATLMVQTQRAAEAVSILRRLTAQYPTCASIWTNLGAAHSRLKQDSEATECYRHSLGIDPTDRDVLKNLVTSLNKQKRYSEVIPAIEELRSHPSFAYESISNRCALLSSLGNAYSHEGKRDLSIACFDSCLAWDPDCRSALIGLGRLLQKEIPPPENGIKAWHRLTELEPENPAYRNNYATMLKNAFRYAEAEQECREALRILPGFFQAQFNLALTIAAVGRFDEAKRELHEVVAYEKTPTAENVSKAILDSMELDADSLSKYKALAWSQLAAVENFTGNADNAWEAVHHCFEIDPCDYQAKMMRAFLYLQVGDYENGWPAYEARHEGEYAPRSFHVPRWNGEHHPQATLLIHAEQGLGDSIHFIRYAQLAKERVHRVLFLTHRALVPLMKRMPWIDEVIAEGDSLPFHSLHIPLMSLPNAFRTTFDDVPASVPYLDIDRKSIEEWGRWLQGKFGDSGRALGDGERDFDRRRGDDAYSKHPIKLNIGICWQGNKKFGNDQYRSFPLLHFRPIASLPFVRLISLQSGDGSEQILDVDFAVETVPDLDRESAFMDTAALMHNLDLIITSDTSIAHLAGALGVPVWLAKPFMTEWRWLSKDVERNPWYPTMRMFMQPRIGDWDSVFARMRDELLRLM
jgi:tetratricopeptide (TPR) repeat protein